MEDDSKQTMPKSLKKKLIIAMSLLVAFALAVVLLVTLTAEKPYVLKETGEGRPTSLPHYDPVKITDPAYAEPTVGAGVTGPPIKAKEMDPAYFEPLHLPFVDAPNITAGNGFDVKAEELKPSEKYVATAYPKGSSSTSETAVIVGKGETDAEGKLSFLVTFPTNLGLGAYVLEVKGPSKTFTTPFVIRP